MPMITTQVYEIIKPMYHPETRGYMGMGAAALVFAENEEDVKREVSANL